MLVTARFESDNESPEGKIILETLAANANLTKYLRMAFGAYVDTEEGSRVYRSLVGTVKPRGGDSKVGKVPKVKQADAIVHTIPIAQKTENVHAGQEVKGSTGVESGEPAKTKIMGNIFQACE